MSWRSSDKHWLKHHFPRDVVYRITLRCEKCGRDIMTNRDKDVCPYGVCTYSKCVCGRNLAVGSVDWDKNAAGWFHCRCGSGFLGHQTYAEQRKPPVAAKRSRHGRN